MLTNTNTNHTSTREDTLPYSQQVSLLSEKKEDFNPPSSLTVVTPIWNIGVCPLSKKYGTAEAFVGR